MEGIATCKLPKTSLFGENQSLILLPIFRLMISFLENTILYIKIFFFKRMSKLMRSRKIFVMNMSTKK